MWIMTHQDRHPRAIALSILLSSRRTDDALDELIEQQTTSVLQPRDRSLVMELVYGVLRRQETIDWRLGCGTLPNLFTDCLWSFKCCCGLAHTNCCS